MRYEHHCRACDLRWAEEYSIHDDPPSSCPECRSADCYRMMGTPAFVLKGAGWASDGYYKNAPLDAWKGRIKLYDRKEDYDRETEGEARLKEKNKLKAQNEAIKRTLGYDAQIREREASVKIDKAVKKAKDEL